MAGKEKKRRGPSKKAREAAARKRQLLKLAKTADKGFDLVARGAAYGHGAFQIAEPFADAVPFVMNGDMNGAREAIRIGAQQAMTRQNLKQVFLPIVATEGGIALKNGAKALARFASGK